MIPWSKLPTPTEIECKVVADLTTDVSNVKFPFVLRLILLIEPLRAYEFASITHLNELDEANASTSGYSSP